VREIERRSECRFISGDPSERASERLLPLWAQPKDRCGFNEIIHATSGLLRNILLLFSLLSVSTSRGWMSLEVVMIRFKCEL
jgi:hypothetical protein